MSKAIGNIFALGLAPEPNDEEKERLEQLSRQSQAYLQNAKPLEWDDLKNSADKYRRILENANDPKRTVRQSLSGFKPDNQRWYENNPQKDSLNYVQDDYETNPFVNDCTQSERFNTLVTNIKQPDREGYGYHISDQPTNSGISQNWYDAYKKQNPAFAKEYPESVEDLTQDQVDNLYCQGFYKPNHIETINDDFTAEHIFDMNVNIGGPKSASIIQNSINDISDEQVSTSGGVGTQTISAINNLTEDELRRLNNRMVNRRKKYYDSLNNKKYPGWYSRANLFKK